MKYFIDTEFYDDGIILHPISIGIVDENGSELYLEYEFDIDSFKPNDNIKWLKENVMTSLHGKQTNSELIRCELANYFSNTSGYDIKEFWLYYGTWDWLIFVRSIAEGGLMLNLPYNFKMYFNEIMQLGEQNVVKAKKDLDSNGAIYNHNALADAKYQRDLYNSIVKNEI